MPETQPRNRQGDPAVGHHSRAENDVEAPEADRAEQHIAARGDDDEPGPRPSVSRIRFDVDPADLADQERVVEYDEDDYR